MTIKIRKARLNELEWINKKYDEIQFVHSNFDNELIAVAENEHDRMGLGRLVEIDKLNLELGGIYVFEPFRGQGIAGQIVEYLLRNAPPGKTIYCIPFVKLIPFYEKYGFKSYTGLSIIPKKISEKVKCCGQSYDDPVHLLVLST